ncbi:M91 family zinc metallopeptidase [Nocardia sp. GTS18]|uniref:M91 family zinc metallopeptidase n=1 Tax=Nocardia sp. GTS18 TaxID=1778064 RepID=UPI0015EF083B|nr:M91 family zinc metallopeptidase [Nocardia sp. GTS18]
MALSWSDVVSWDSEKLVGAARALSHRCTSVRDLEGYISRSSALADWTGAAKDAAQQSLLKSKTELGRIAGIVEPLRQVAIDRADTMDRLRTRARDAETWAATEGFEVDADGSVSDVWQRDGRDTDLTDAERARRTTVRAEIVTSVATIVSEAQAGDQLTASALQTAATELGGGLAPAGQPDVVTTDKAVVIKTGEGDDKVEVHEDPQTHVVTVTVNGQKYEYEGQQAQNITIFTEGGNDTINVDPGTQVGLKLEGGAGNDKIQGGGGKDYINGAGGDDILGGGTGDDVVYGGDGNDTMFGGDGNDYLEGSAGDDTVFGGFGNDTVSGGLGNDRLQSGGGDDKVYTGGGGDSVGNEGGNDTIYAQVGEDSVSDAGQGGNNKVVNVVLTDIPDNVTVTGSPEFQDRVRADLEFMRSSPTGQQMLAGLGETPHNVNIVEGATGKDSAVATDPRAADLGADGKPGAGSASTIVYNPRGTTFSEVSSEYAGTAYDHHPPITTLYHEAAHAYDETHGTMRPVTDVYTGDDAVDRERPNIHSPTGNGMFERERVAVGLTIDHDNNPDTPEQLADEDEHPYALTENAMREELGIARRDHYAPK